MSEEQRNEETEVEAHGTTRPGANDEPGDEVEGHRFRVGMNDEGDDDEVEGHMSRAG
jgi:hypothetical protein